MATVAEALLTAEEYAQLPDNGGPTELVRGRIVVMNPPYPYHGYVCVNICRIVGDFVEKQDCGRVVGNDSGVITDRGPDTVRGADVAFYSYQRLPRGPFPRGYLAVVPDLIFEVRSPGDPWSEILIKVGEYLNIGVTVVAIADPTPRTVTVYRLEPPPEVFSADQELELPDVLAGFRVAVRRFFD